MKNACDHCGLPFGLSVRRWGRHRFCKLACLNAFKDAWDLKWLAWLRA